MIRNVSLSDAARIAGIYNYYIDNTIITFEEEKIDADEIEQRIFAVWKNKYPYLVYEENGITLGYAYLGKWRTRSAYDITLETSIYLDVDSTGRGIGELLYKALIEESWKINIHSLIGVISLPNDASRRLHEKLGFRLAGFFPESGKKFGKLVDVEFWQMSN